MDADHQDELRRDGKRGSGCLPSIGKCQYPGYQLSSNPGGPERGSSGMFAQLIREKAELQNRLTKAEADLKVEEAKTKEAYK